MTSNPNSPDFNYKDYSLEKLQEWVHDAMSSDASPHEIYSAIRESVREDYYYHKDYASRTYGLLELLSGHRPVKDAKWDEWEETYYPEEQQYTEEELNAMCDKAASDDERNKCREYNLREAEYYNKRAQLDANYVKAKIEANSAWNDGFTQKYYQDIVDKYEGKTDKPKKWVLPVEETKIAETDETDYFVTFPDDLLEAANLKVGDQVEWVDNGDGSYLLKKVEKKAPTYDEMIAAGYWMTDDGFWMKGSIEMDKC